MAYNPNPPLGSSGSANSLPVVISSDQASVPIDDDGASITIDAVSLPLPTGASTLAEQQTQTTALQLLDDTVYTDGAGTVTKGIVVFGQDGTNPQAIKTDSSGELQVDVLTLPTATVTATNLDIRDLTFAADKVDASGTTLGSNSGVDIGDVTINNGAAGSAVNIQDGGNTITVDGTIAATQSGTWNVTNVSGTISLPTGASTLAEQQTQTTHLATIAGDTTDIETAVELIDDTVATLGTTTYAEATTKGLVIGAVRRDADTTLVTTTNEVAPLQVDANGRLKVEVFSGETLPVSLTSTTITGTVAVTQSGTWDEVGINDSGNSITVDAPVGTPVNVQIGDGTRQATVRDTGSSDSLNVAIVDGSGNQITTFGGGTEYTVNAAVPTDPVGATFTMERDDQLATLSEAEADWTNPRATSKGALWVAIADSSGDPITSFGGGTQYTEDAAAASDPVGTVQILVRQDTPGAVANTDGDNVAQRGTNYGAAYVTLLDTGGSPVAVGGGTQYTEDAAAAANPIGTATILVRADTPGTIVTTDGDNVALRGTNYGAAYAQIVTSAGAFVDTFGGGIQYDQGSSDASITGTVAMMEVAADTLQPIQGTVADGLLVNLGSNNDVTVTGTVSATQSGTWNVTNISGTISLPTGASTLAEQQTQTTHLATIAGDTTDIEAAVELIDDTVAVLGTTTYSEATTKGLIVGAIRRDADTTLVDTTNEVSPLQVDANGRLKVEVFSGESLPVTLTSTTVTGTVAVTQSGTWNITNISGTVSLPTGASTLAEQQSQTTHLATIAGDTTDIETAVELIDDTVATLGTTTYSEATTKGLIIGAVRRDADTTLVDTTNEICPLQVDASGRLKVEAFSGETLPVSLTSTTITGTVASTQSGTWNITNISGTVSLPTGAATETTLGSLLTSSQLIDDTIFTSGTDTYAEATTKGQLMLGVRRDADTTLANTTNEVVPFQVDANGYLKVEVFDGGGTHTVDAPLATPVNVQIGNATLAVGVIDETGASAVDALAVGGGTAHDAVDSGNPVKMGAKVVAHGSNPTAIAAGDRTNLYANAAGIPFSIGGHPNIVSAEYFSSGAITDDNILPAISTGTIYIITSITVTCSAANATSPAVRIGFGTASVPAQGSTNADAVSKVILSHPGIPAGGGVQKGNGSGIVGVGGDGEELRITCGTPTTSLIVQVDYFTITI